MATAAMRDQPHMRSIVHRTIEIRERFSEDCRTLGLTVPKSHTNFVLIRFASAELAADADKRLRAHKLALRKMGPYGLADCLRATICEQNIMDRCLKVLKEVLQ
jgi:histidinol-phosphate/aromatic aminotransferase/cobyric acid decarboxylase-like protein